VPDILIVEDKDAKFDDLKKVVEEAVPSAAITRATTVVEAENLLSQAAWSMIVLDISMDINGTSKGALGGGHASLGGLDVVDTMYYEGLEVPTVVVTGLDYFISSKNMEGADYIGLEELETMVRQKLASQYLGCIRYGIDGWSARFKTAFEVIEW
jgi:CheY-like chemotaxis protein